VTSELEEEILKIENEIKGTDSDMKQLNEKIVQGFRAVVDLDGLSHRLF
jgi:peptidoglycan hydrolase CwlO-like protein